MFTNEYYSNEMEANDLEFETLVSNKKKIMTCCNVVIGVGRWHANN